MGGAKTVPNHGKKREERIPKVCTSQAHAMVQEGPSLFGDGQLAAYAKRKKAQKAKSMKGDDLDVDFRGVRSHTSLDLTYLSQATCHATLLACC